MDLWGPPTVVSGCIPIYTLSTTGGESWFPLKPAAGFLPVDDGLPSATTLSTATGATGEGRVERGIAEVTKAAGESKKTSCLV